MIDSRLYYIFNSLIRNKYQTSYLVFFCNDKIINLQKITE